MLFRTSTQQRSGVTEWVRYALFAGALALTAGCGEDSDTSATDAERDNNPGDSTACTRDADCGAGSFCDLSGARAMQLPKNAEAFACFETCAFECDFFDDECEDACARGCGLDQLSCGELCDYFCEGNAACRSACIPECQADRDGTTPPPTPPPTPVDPPVPPGTTCESFCTDECEGVPPSMCFDPCMDACEGNTDGFEDDQPGTPGTPPPTAQGVCRPSAPPQNPPPTDPGPSDPAPVDPPADMNWIGTWSFEVTYTANCRLSVATQPPSAKNYFTTGRLTGSNADITASFENNTFRMAGNGNNARMILSGSFPARDHRDNTATQVERDNNIDIRITEIVDANTARGTISGSYDTRGGVSCEIADGGTVEITR